MEERGAVEDMVVAGGGVKVGLSRKDALCRSKWIAGVN